MKISGSDILIKSLIDHGVETIFGYPGGAVLNIYDALYDYEDEIRHILTVDEQGAAYAANGYARATGKTGVVLATSGPGATNLITGIADAYMDSIPMVAITGNVAQHLIGKDSFQEIYITGITMPITKHNFVVRKIEDLAETVAKAFRIASTGRKGPVLIDIPKDVTAALYEYEAPSVLAPTPSREVDKVAFESLVELINKAKRPVIYAGGGIVSGDAIDLLRRLIRQGNLPACHTAMGVGILEGDDELNLGMVGMHGNSSANHAVENCDALIALGVRFSDRVALNFKHFAPHAKIAHVEIDPSELNKNIELDLEVVGDVREVIEMLLDKVEFVEREAWKATIRDLKAADFKPADDPKELKPHQLMASIEKFIDENAIIATDVGQHQMWAAQYAKRTRPRRFLTSGGLGAMGFGYGAAMGAQIAEPDSTVVHITGDASFHMNMNEVATAVHYKLPIITVIMDNHALGMPRQWQHYLYKDRYALTDFYRATDYVAMAKAMGARGVKPENMEEFEAAFTDALESGQPTLIWCEIYRSEQVLPMIPGGGTVSDIIMTE